MNVNMRGRELREIMSLPAASTEPGAYLVARNVTMRKGCVSVLVPIYNEVDHVDELLDRIHASPVDKEIIIIDDGSTDGTREKLVDLPPSADVDAALRDPESWASGDPATCCIAMRRA